MVSEIDKKRLFSPPINLLYINKFENRFIPDSRGDTRQNHLKIIEHEHYFKEIYMFSMCPLVVFMIFAAKYENFSTILRKNL